LRHLLPVVQVPPRGVWGEKATARWMTVEAWLGQPVDGDETPDSLILRYLAAFGPATLQDVATWSGLTKMREVMERLRAGLRTFRDESGRELFDVPNGALPDADTPAPPRFLPQYDNVFLAHADRARIVDDADRKRFAYAGGRSIRTFLLDGFIRGSWTIERRRGGATLQIRPHDTLAKRDRNALIDEGVHLLAFAAADEGEHDIEILDAR
jgi:hypothetical protein